MIVWWVWCSLGCSTDARDVLLTTAACFGKLGQPDGATAGLSEHDKRAGQYHAARTTQGAVFGPPGHLSVVAAFAACM